MSPVALQAAVPAFVETRRSSTSVYDRAAALAFSEAVTLAASERITLAALLLRAGTPTGTAWPTIGELADVTGLQPRSVQRVVRRLVAAGLVATELVEVGGTMPSGFRSPTMRVVYRLSVPSTVAPAFVGARLGDALRADLPTTEKVVFAVLALHANANGDAWPSYARVGRMAGLSERAVGGAVARLRARGLLLARRVAPGGPLPSGETATTWRVVLRVLRPRPGCTETPTVVPRDPDPRAGEVSPRRETSKAEEPAVAGLLQSFADRLETDDLGADAAKVLEARLADGLSVADLEHAVAGVASVPWRMEARSRRTVRAVFGTLEKTRGFLERGRPVDLSADLLPAPPPPPPPPSREELRARSAKVADALARFARPPA